jgi:effector-binding domain-containing protein
VSDLAPEIIDLAPSEAIAVRGEVAIADLPTFFARAFHEAAEAAEACGVDIVGPPFGFYPEMPTETVAVEAGFPVSAPAEPVGSAHRLVLPGGRAVRAMHVGPYETMEQTYADLQSWMSERDIEPAGKMWECYLSDPAIEPDPETWRTQVVWPIKT